MRSTEEILREAASARRTAAMLTTEEKNGALYAMADSLVSDAGKFWRRTAAIWNGQRGIFPM